MCPNIYLCPNEFLWQNSLIKTIIGSRPRFFQSKNDLMEVWQSAISKRLLFYCFQLSKPLYKLTITDRQKKPLIGAQACALPKKGQNMLGQMAPLYMCPGQMSLTYLLVKISSVTTEIMLALSLWWWVVGGWMVHFQLKHNFCLCYVVCLSNLK